MFLTILFFSVMMYKVIFSLKKYFIGDKAGEETDERFMKRAFLDDTTTDIEKYLTNKQD